jgi:hypothetical protein
LKGAIISDRDGQEIVTCTIRDVSATGARLRLERAFETPTHFRLAIDVDGFEVACELRWCKGQDIGVKFLRPPPDADHKHHRSPSCELWSGPHDALAAGPNASASWVDGECADAWPTTTSMAQGQGERTGRVQAPASHRHNELIAVLLVLDVEILQTCALVGVSGCVANALAHNVPQLHSRALTKYYPRESAALIIASSRIGRWYPASRLRELLNAFNAAMSRAKRNTLAFVAATQSSDHGQQSDREELATGWREAATAGIGILQELEALFALHGMMGSSRPVNDLVELLKAVADGAHPLVGFDAAVQLPAWADRRITERARIATPAEIYVGTARYSVTVRDMSVSGLGIDCSEQLPVGTRVNLRMGRFPELAGMVVWSTKGQLGVQLSEPLHGADPRLAFSDRVAQGNVQARPEHHGSAVR